MKRLDADPTEEILLDSIANDRTGRNQDIADFIRMLEDTKGPYSYMIDAPWGEGKTFFVKSVELLLLAMNSNIPSEESNQTKLRKILTDLEDVDTPFLPFYFNAWSNDFADDPIAALFVCMCIEFERKDLLNAKLAEAIAAIIDTGLSAAQIPFKVSGLIDAVAARDSLITTFKQRMEVRARITELCEDAIREVANKLVIFVDELDRCRPDFAVRLLEQTKHLFTNENVILVFSTDSFQLAKAVGGVYGAGFDTSRFLERFFDERITMAAVDSYAFTHDGNPIPSSNKFDSLASELIRGNELTIRDAYRIKKKLDLARDYCLNNSHVNFSQMVASFTILPLLIFIEREDINLFRTITSGIDCEALYEYGKTYRVFLDNLDETIERLYQGIPDDQKPDFVRQKDCRAYMRDLCITIYRDRSHPGYREAEERIGDFGLTPTNQRIYRQLKFE